MNRIIVYSLLIFCLGCDFLEEYSQDKMKPTSVEDYDNLLIGEAYPMLFGDFFPYHDLLTDDIGTFVSSVINDPKELETIESVMPFYEWDPKMFELMEKKGILNLNTWETLYKVINRTNIIVQKVEESKGDVNKKLNIKAQALSLRVFYYYYLINIFSDPYNSGNPYEIPGIPIITDFEVEDNFPACSSVGEVYEFMIEDLTTAIDLFEETEQEYAKHPCRMTKIAAYSMLSRIYLQMEHWQEVVNCCDKVLMVNGRLINMVDHLSVGGNYDGNALPYVWKSGVLGSASIECIFGVCNTVGVAQFLKTVSTPMQPFRAFEPSEELMNLYDVWVEKIPLGGGIQFKYHGDIRFCAYYVQRQPIPRNRKPFYGKKGTNTNSMQFGIRTPEIYLNRMEAQIQLLLAGKGGDRAQVVSDLDYLRLHRWNTKLREYIPISEDPKIMNRIQTNEGLLSFYKEERRRELSFEHIRWFDLRRYGREKLVHKIDCYGVGMSEAVLEEGDARFTIPIPEKVRLRNPNLNR